MERDRIEKNFSYLFETASVKVDGCTDKHPTEDTIVNLKNELLSKEKELDQVKETLKVQKKDTEKLNDEIISLNIENNLLQERLQKLTEEYDGLVDRWLKRVQGEADWMNQTLE